MSLILFQAMNTKVRQHCAAHLCSLHVWLRARIPSLCTCAPCRLECLSSTSWLDNRVGNSPEWEFTRLTVTQMTAHASENGAPVQHCQAQLQACHSSLVAGARGGTSLWPGDVAAPGALPSTRPAAEVAKESIQVARLTGSIHPPPSSADKPTCWQVGAS